jgi:peptidoglycan/LPS O-acetylase OafA/YrhL
LAKINKVVGNLDFSNLVLTTTQTIPGDPSMMPIDQKNAKTGKHLPALDGVRGLAVLIVVAFHTGGGAQSSNPIGRAIGLTLKVGWSGVTLFFVLSGFLITGILWDSKGAEHWWRNFYVRRVLRISPLYYGSLLLVLVISGVFRNAPGGWRGLWIYALYLQNIPWIVDTGAGLRPLPLTHFWSLAVEEQFYLAWPLLLYKLKTFAQVKHVCLAIFLSSIAFRCAVWMMSPQPEAYNGFLLSRAGELALGGYLAMRLRDGSWNSLERIAPYLTVGSLLGFVAVCAPSHIYELTNIACATAGLALITVFYAGLIVLALGDGLVHRAMGVAWLRWVGGISYGIYVFHVLLLPVYAWIAEALVPHAGRIEAIAVRGVVTWVVTALVAWLSYRYFEAPILGLWRYFGSRPRSAKPEIADPA